MTMTSEKLTHTKATKEPKVYLADSNNVDNSREFSPDLFDDHEDTVKNRILLLPDDSEQTPEDLSGCAGSRKRKLSQLNVQSTESTLDNHKPVCKYGSGCYRKNPAHFQEFHHDDGDQTKKVCRESAGTASSCQTRDVGDPKLGASPYNFMLTTSAGIPEEYNDFLSVGIKDILSPEMGQLKASAQFNYLADVDWLMQQYPRQFRTKPLLLVCGEDKQRNKALLNEIAPYPNVSLCQARLEMAYGTHHTKMMLLLYESSLRIVIHTANLIPSDWHQKTQGVWLSPPCPRLPEGGGGHDGESVTGFKHDIIEYIAAYHRPELDEWARHLRGHDLSSIKVHLVGSVPGRHTGARKLSWGHMKLKKLLQTHGPTHELAKNWPVLAQFSSIGSLGQTADGWLLGEFLLSVSTVHGGGTTLGVKPKLQLVFPSKDNIRLSLEGYPAGASVPYSINVAKRQPYLTQYLHQWKSEGRGRSRSSPHIKSYIRYCPQTGRAAWFLLTSANLSKAAWGALEKSKTQLMIRSYELGVLFVPRHLIGEDVFSVSSRLVTLKQSSNVFPLPYDLPPKPYGPTDKPWIWDIAYTDLPDSHGNVWSPP